MNDLLAAATSWQSLSIVVAVFGLLPNLLLHVIVRTYPASHPRRRELLAEFWAVPRIQRPLWVAEQLTTVLFEALPIRFRRLHIYFLTLTVVVFTASGLRAWLLRLPSQQRAALILRIIAGFSRETTANLLGISEGKLMLEQHFGLSSLRRRAAESGSTAAEAIHVRAMTKPSPYFNNLKWLALRKLKLKYAEFGGEVL